MEFQGRAADLDTLAKQLTSIADGRGATRGRAVILTGRRRVGKSRLAQEFCDRSGRPYVLFQATRGRNPVAERADFAAALAQSSLPGAELVAGLQAGDWNHALRSLAAALPDDSPTIVVIDEVPWLIERDAEFEGALQTVWDRHLSSKRVLLLLIGSDIALMESLRSAERPFFGRAAVMAVKPMHLADVSAMTGLAAADAVDALLITGGFPEIVQSWPSGMGRLEFLQSSIADPLSPLLVAGELSLLGEFPESALSRAVLEAVGNGERTFATIAANAGGASPLSSGTLAPLLNMLVAKQVLAADLPLSTKPDSRNKRYRVADPYLRFWLALLQRTIPMIERGRSDLARDRIERGWSAWRGRAVAPIVRESLMRLLPDERWTETEAVGGWWNRQNKPEIDLVGMDRHQVQFVGSIKWLERAPFGRREYEALVRDVLAVPGADASTPLVAVSRAGAVDGLPLAAAWGPDDLVRAWHHS